MLVDDVVLEFGGKTVANFAALQGLVKKRKPGERVKLKVQRGDEVVELELVVGRS